MPVKRLAIKASKFVVLCMANSSNLTSISIDLLDMMLDNSFLEMEIMYCINLTTWQQKRKQEFSDNYVPLVYLHINQLYFTIISEIICKMFTENLFLKMLLQ